MIGVKKYRNKPLYKKFANLKIHFQNRKKLIRFKKQKWKNVLFSLKKISKNQKRNCYYKFYDQNLYKTVRYQNYFSKRYKQSIVTKKIFNLFYGTLNKNYLKNVLKKSKTLSNQLQNKINFKLIFLDLIETRLDIVLLRSNFVLSIRNARQIISHKHVYVNDKVVSSNSFLTKQGDTIKMSPNIHNKIKLYVILSEFWPLPPSYLQINYKLFQIRVLDNTILSNNLSTFLIWLNLQSVTQSYLK